MSLDKIQSIPYGKEVIKIKIFLKNFIGKSKILVLHLEE